MKKFIIASLFCVSLVLGFSVDAFACGKPFHANLTVKPIGYGSVDGNENDVYYHLTPRRAGLEVSNVSGGQFTAILCKGKIFSKKIDGCYEIVKPDWRIFYNIPNDGYDYWLRLVVEGTVGHSYRISGKLHDHGNPR